MESKYTVLNTVIENFKDRFEQGAEACGYILGEREYKSKPTEDSESVRVLGLLKLPISIEEAISLEEIRKTPHVEAKRDLTKLLLSSIPAGIEVVGVFIVGNKHFSEWEENERLDILNALLTYDMDGLDDLESEYLVWSLKDKDLLPFLYSKEEICNIGLDGMNIVAKDVEKLVRRKHAYRLKASFAVSVDAEIPTASFGDEINRIMHDLSMNCESAYLVPDIQTILTREVAIRDADDFEIVVDSEKLASKMGKLLKEKEIIDVNLINFLGNAEIENHAEVPALAYEKVEQERLQLSLQVDCILQPNSDVTVDNFVMLLDQAIIQQLTAYKYLSNRFSSTLGFCSYAPFHFQHSVHEHFLTCMYPVKSYEMGTVNDSMLVSYRKELHEAFLLTKTRPCLKPCLSLFSVIKHDRLVNPHESIPSNFSEGVVAKVHGKYSYYHYMQDRFNDDHWGCAYRSLQTLCSWYNHQGYSYRSVPSHKEIQEALVAVGDKDPKFIGSRQWIGSFEVSMCLEKLLGMKARILHVNMGSEMGSKGRELVQHFSDQGTPIMIGGGVLAHTILGVWFHEGTGETKFLILDPHYTGVDELKPVLSKGWCGWKGVDFWDQTAHYNLCLPQRPIEV